MVVVKRKQIVALSLFLMVLVAGYVQYNMKQSSVAVNSDDEKIGDTVYVDGVSTSLKDSSAQTASKEVNDYFAQVKLERDVSRSKDSDSLKSISNDASGSKEAKAQAQQKMLQIVNSTNKENRIEALIKDTGISDVVTFFGDDGSVDIIVKAPSLTSAQVAKISDIVSRQANVPITKIFIKNIF